MVTMKTVNKAPSVMMEMAIMVRIMPHLPVMESVVGGAHHTLQHVPCRGADVRPCPVPWKRPDIPLRQRVVALKARKDMKEVSG